MTLLAEIPEARATGPVAKLYDDIRAVLNVPFVVLVYRALAVTESRLGAVWDAVRPNLLHEQTHRLADMLGTASTPAVSPVGSETIAASGLDEQRAADTLAAFHRANTRNAVVLWALQDGHKGPPAPIPVSAPRTAIRSILPMADIASLPGSVTALLSRMSAPIAGAGPPVVIPSLLRYFALDERLLEELWTSLRPWLESDTYREQVADVCARARASANELPYEITRCDDTTAREIITRFLHTIPAMIATAPMIAGALLPRQASFEVVRGRGDTM